MNQHNFKFNLDSCLIGIAGMYHDMHTRSINVAANFDGVEAIMRATNNGNSISSAALTNANVHNMAGIARDKGNATHINGGWNTGGRGVFNMVISDALNPNRRWILSGHISPGGVTYNAINADAMFTFNTLTELQGQVDYQGIIQWQLMSSDVCLAPSSPINQGQGSVLRPADVLAQTMNRAIAGKIDPTRHYAAPNDPMTGSVPTLPMDQIVQSNTGGIESGFKFSAGNNLMPKDYLARSLTAIRDSHAENLSNNQDEGQPQNIFASAMANRTVAETGLQNSDLMATLLGVGTNNRAGGVSYNTLAATVAGMLDVGDIRDGKRVGILMDGSSTTTDRTNNWSGRQTAPMAQEAAQMIHSTLSQANVIFASFTMNNNTIDGRPVFNWMQHPEDASREAISFSANGLPEEQLKYDVVAKLTNLMFPQVSMGSRVTLTVNCSTVKDIEITITYADKAPVVYSALASSIALWNSVRASDQVSLSSVSNSMLEINNQMLQGREQAQSGNSATNQHAVVAPMPSYQPQAFVQEPGMVHAQPVHQAAPITAPNLDSWKI